MDELIDGWSDFLMESFKTLRNKDSFNFDPPCLLNGRGGRDKGGGAVAVIIMTL